MTYDENLLVYLNEECCEVAQRANKALKFGINEVGKGQNLTNAERIVYEFNDIYAVMEMMLDAGMIDKIIDRDAIEAKKSKAAKWIAYSIEQGCIKS